MKIERKKEILSWIRAFAIAILVAFLFRNYLLSPTTVHGESMNPTFDDKDRVIISKISDIERFDIVVFDAPDSNLYYIKRVIGLPGDHLQMKDGELYINGIKTEEPYLKEQNDKDIFLNKMNFDFTLEEITGEFSVPKDSLFVMGDNRANSNDSRFFGFISRESIIGEVKFQIYPIHDVGFIK